MREILFRGKRKSDGEWIDGYYVQTNDFLDERKLNLIFEANSVNYPHSEIVGTHEVDPETIGQYTGLTDKNGVKIFEGDIIKFDGGWEEYGGNVFEVVFTNGCFYLGRNPDTICFLLKNFVEWAEIVGNIYDSPELLGGDDK
jgi:uncharacterized phage protein (TIGR01671 family)